MTARRVLLVAIVFAVLPTSGCVTYPRGWDAEQEGRDPYEGTNRGVFRFNEGLDDYVFEPVATGWEFVTWEGFRKSVDKFFVNLAFPRRLVANLGQGELRQAGTEVGRFFLNTTVGIAGLFDPATHWGIPLYDEDFGQMFGRWGIGPGPYWVLPLFGPSNPRDTVGLVFDTVFDIRTIASFTPVVTLAWTGALQNVNRRALLDEDIELARDAALDFYVFARDAYIQRRAALVADEDLEKELSEPVSNDLYEVDFEDEEPAEESDVAPN